MPRYAAAYLLVHEGRAAFVDNNTVHAVPRMLEALAAEGLGPDAVDYCIITHVHLDHAGGSSALMKACPEATLIAHPRAAPHAIDPSKLVKSASAVYGEEAFEKLYGVIEPIDASRVRALDDAQTLDLGGAKLSFLHTRGHANHHFVIHVPEAKAVFTGDAFGIIYPDLAGTRGPFAFPSSSPTDFDAALALAAVDRITELEPEVVYPTHFGPCEDVQGVAQQLRADLRFSDQVMMHAYASEAPDEALEQMIAPRLRARFDVRMEEHGVTRTDAHWERLAMDLELNAQGLAFVAAKKRRKDREASA